MRKIEREMLDRISNKQSGNFGSNMGVFIETNGNPYGTRAEVYLHGNHIADVWYGNRAYEVPEKERIDVNVRTLKRYPTRTTLSRLRALGANVRLSKGIVLLDNKPLD